MANKVSIEEQVAQLTPQQQDNILKAGKIATIVDSIFIAAMMLWGILGILVILDPPRGADSLSILIGVIVGEVIGMLCVLAVSAFIMIKYPYYSDKKLKYIKNLRKR